METDEELIAAINTGDCEAFESLYYRYRDWVYNLAFRFTHNREHSLDVLQEVYLYFLKKIPGFKLTSSIKTFFYPVIKHVSITISGKARGVSGEELISKLPAVEAENSSDQRGELLRVMGVLPLGSREVVLMRYVDDMSLAEIAEVLKIPVSTVKSRLYRSLETLRADGGCRRYFLDEG
jgi:RNA polymerase sigma-70 factor (ECF subfamily)